MKRILFFIAMTAVPWAQETAQITGLSMDTKKNGIFIRIHSDRFIEPARVTGWQNREWFYMTIHQAQADTALLEASTRSRGVKSVDCSLVGESVQLGFKLANPIEQFEFYFTEDTPEILASLRFPLAEVLASIEPKIKSAQAIKREQTFENPRYRAVIRALYFMGSGLTTGGFLAREKNKGWEISVGLGLIAGAYIYDNFIHGKKK